MSEKREDRSYASLPVGIDDFGKLIRGNYYYADKTWMIKELLDKKNEVNLFTRPRRFGKTLNMSMLRCFFEDTGDRERTRQNVNLFQGLAILRAKELCAEHMGKYPVISLSLKSAKQPTFRSALFKLREEIWREFERHAYVLERLSGVRRAQFQLFLEQKATEDMDSGALRFLSEVLQEYHGRPAVILIDEYDVPLENAFFSGFYEEMAGFIRSLFESALKTNEGLNFAVVTGCLRISRESIFTGLNNLNVISIMSGQYSECFGFSQAEVDRLLAEYDLCQEANVIKKWYDGYLFGQTNVYNPWSMINYVQEACFGGIRYPRPYWSNTSSNSIVQELVRRADASVKTELEGLLEGGTLVKPIHEDITYDTVFRSEENLWNFLFFTGYLKQVSNWMNGRQLMVELAIPNEEVAYIYDNTIRNWFQDEIRALDLSRMYQALMEGEADAFQRQLAALLQKSISYMDSREAFYHGFLLGVLGNMRDYIVKSNREKGHGRLDILVRSPDVEKAPVILELKVAETFQEMEEACEKALTQIRERQYESELSEEGYTGVWNYGIAFFRKQCRVKAEYAKLERKWKEE